ncbi:MAG: PCMD domain-containing protein [Muribaculaceae bacterium]|nr:PCMD domain-containing protein [Muribaculaceae bacterium]
MKKIYQLIFLLAAMLVSNGCSDESTKITGEEDSFGTLRIATEIEQSLDERMSRTLSADEAASLLKTLNIVVTRSDGAIVKYWKNGEDMSGNESDITSSTVEFSVNAGNYTIEGWAGDSVAASFQSRFYKGLSAVTIARDKTNSVALVCKIANVAVRVNVSDEVKEKLTDYRVVIGNRADSLEFSKTKGTEGLTGYFMMPSYAKDLDWVMHFTRANGDKGEVRGKIENAKSGTLYSLGFSGSVSQDGEPEGGAWIRINTHDFDNTAESLVLVRSNPEVYYYHSGEYDLEGNPVYYNIGENPVYRPLTPGQVGEFNLVFLSSGEITSVELEDETFTQWGLNATVDVFGEANSKGAAFEKLKQHGIFSMDYDVDDVETLTSCYRICFSGDDFEKEKIWNIKVRVTDVDMRHILFPDNYPSVDKRTVEQVFRLEVSAAGVRVVQPDAAEALSVWDNERVLKAQKLDPSVVTLNFEYRVKGSNADWQQIYTAKSFDKRENLPLTVNNPSGDMYYAVVSNLQPSTAYEYRVVYDNRELSPESFTTPAQPVIPNSDFEDWSSYGTKGIVVPCLDYSTNFWDSGNHGSMTMGVNVTNPCGDAGYYHSGSKSALLHTQFVGVGILGKLAAGNIFIGKYLASDGTNGILGWGKPFTGRPRQLKGWVRYEGGTVDNGKDTPRIKVGAKDQGIIYIAMLDDDTATQGDINYPGYPVVVRTKDTHLFDSSAKNVIAYGEAVITDTSSTGLVEFTIDLKYTRNDVAPSYILLTASASIGGDYFTGHDGSKMWLDDLQLVY